MAGMTYTFARSETKYLITQGQRQALLALLGGHVRPDEWGRSTVSSLYCDTGSARMIRSSMDHPAYKEKVRIRSYGQATPDSPVFLEVKKKLRGTTYKRRARMPLARALRFVGGDGDPRTQIEREIAATVARYRSDGGIRPYMLVSCEREALYATDDRDVRITFDEAIRWSDDEPSLSRPAAAWHYLLDDDLVVMEVKCGRGMPLWLVRSLSALGLRPTGFSKCCIAWKQRAIVLGETTATDGLAPAIAHARGCEATVVGTRSGRKATSGWREVPAPGRRGREAAGEPAPRTAAVALA